MKATKKPFVCDHCGQGFRKEVGLQDHRTFVHGEPHPLACEQCDGRFLNKKHLHAHMKSAHPVAPKCIECGSVSELVTGREIYPHRPDLFGRNYYRCACGAYCGCHDGTAQALGYPCGPETRKARSAAHAAFDPMWRRGGLSRASAYSWLASVLGIDTSECHIGMMSADRARLVVEACKQREAA